MHFVVAYDICDPKRLRRVARFMERRAVRCQKSVFLFRGSQEGVLRLFREIVPLLELREDSVLAWRLSADQDPNGLGLGDSLAVYPSGLVQKGTRTYFVEGNR